MKVVGSAGSVPSLPQFERYPENVRTALNKLSHDLGDFAKRLSIEYQGTRKVILIRMNGNLFAETLVRLKTTDAKLAGPAGGRDYRLNGIDLVLSPSSAVEGIK